MLVSELKSDINFHCGSTSATYPDTDKLRNMNIEYQRVATLIWDSQNGWEHMDSNATDFDIATTTLVVNQQDYGLPTTAQRIIRVEGPTMKLERIDQSDVNSVLASYQGSGTPRYYDMVGRSIFVYPTPNVSAASGIKIYYNRDVTPLSAASGTPGFATAFHRMLSYAASIDFISDETQRNHLIRQKDRLEKGLVRFYSRREQEGPVKIRPSSRRKWRKYI